MNQKKQKIQRLGDFSAGGCRNCRGEGGCPREFLRESGAAKAALDAAR